MTTNRDNHSDENALLYVTKDDDLSSIYVDMDKTWSEGDRLYVTVVFTLNELSQTRKNLQYFLKERGCEQGDLARVEERWEFDQARGLFRKIGFLYSTQQGEKLYERKNELTIWASFVSLHSDSITKKVYEIVIGRCCSDSPTKGLERKKVSAQSTSIWRRPLPKWIRTCVVIFWIIFGILSIAGLIVALTEAPSKKEPRQLVVFIASGGYMSGMAPVGQAPSWTPGDNLLDSLEKSSQWTSHRGKHNFCFRSCVQKYGTDLGTYLGNGLEVTSQTPVEKPLGYETCVCTGTQYVLKK